MISQGFGNSYEDIWLVWYSLGGVEARVLCFSGFQLSQPPLVRNRCERVNRWKDFIVVPPLEFCRVRDGEASSAHADKQVRARYGIDLVRVYLEANRRKTGKGRTSTSMSRPWRARETGLDADRQAERSGKS